MIVLHIGQRGRAACGLDVSGSNEQYGMIPAEAFLRRPYFSERFWCRACVVAWEAVHPKRAKVPLVQVACPYCGGAAILGYKMQPHRGKCSVCKRIFKVVAA